MQIAVRRAETSVATASKAPVLCIQGMNGPNSGFEGVAMSVLGEINLAVVLRGTLLAASIVL